MPSEADRDGQYLFTLLKAIKAEIDAILKAILTA
jgi:hypothetical protein